MKVPDFWVGIDEVGRGPIAGPVTIGIVCISKKQLPSLQQCLSGVTDSKKLTARRRLFFFDQLPAARQAHISLYSSTASVSAAVIDNIGITRAIAVAIARALQALRTKQNINPNQLDIKLDGLLRAPKIYTNQQTIIKGDEKEFVIGLASIVAKQKRDAYMTSMAQRWPQYGFESHKGYGTRKHYEAIHRHGVCRLHRKSYLKSAVKTLDE